MTRTTTLELPPPAPTASPWPIAPLWREEEMRAGGEVRGGVLPPALADRHAAPFTIRLHPDRPTLIANFVSTLDGVVALDRHGRSGGRDISGGFEPDRFLMGLLRATADAVVVGAGTVRASGAHGTHGWAPAHVYPPAADSYAAWRRELGLVAPTPTTVIVTASGRLEPDQVPPDPSTPVLIATTTAGAGRLTRQPLPDHVEVVALGEGASIRPEALVDAIGDRGLWVVVTEGGPHLFAQLLAAQRVDELFLTVAPQLVGRSAEAARLSLVDGVDLPPAARWGHLRSVMRAHDHLFLRYQLTQPAREDLP